MTSIDQCAEDIYLYASIPSSRMKKLSDGLRLGCQEQQMIEGWSFCGQNRYHHHQWIRVGGMYSNELCKNSAFHVELEMIYWDLMYWRIVIYCKVILSPLDTNATYRVVYLHFPSIKLAWIQMFSIRTGWIQSALWEFFISLYWFPPKWTFWFQLKDSSSSRHWKSRVRKSLWARASMHVLSNFVCWCISSG